MIIKKAKQVWVIWYKIESGGFRSLNEGTTDTYETKAAAEEALKKYLATYPPVLPGSRYDVRPL